MVLDFSKTSEMVFLCDKNNDFQTIGNTSYSTCLQQMTMVARIRTDFTEAERGHNRVEEQVMMNTSENANHILVI